MSLGSPHIMVRIIMIGESGVGKSNLLTRFARDEFHIDNKSTLGMEMTTKTITLPTGEICQSQIWDTAGQERFKSLAISYFRGAKGAVLVYDVTNRHSLESAREWLAEFRKYADVDAVVILVGNKCDLTSNREVETREGVEFAKQEKLLFIEASAKDSINVEQAFIEVLGRITDNTSKGRVPTKGDSSPRTFYRRDSAFINPSAEKGTTIVTIHDEKKTEETPLPNNKKCCQ
ncbi:Ras-related protein Rab [Acrasis kona]|uniref:Ras-related protein Rab n=1 Tax=Acrasis kona TaxID=1008807 RepID=A0AAW2YR85_9EUKA